MKKWDELVIRFIDECRTRGIGEATVLTRESELGRWGKWLRKNKISKIEEINHDHIIEYLKSRTSFS